MKQTLLILALAISFTSALGAPPAEEGKTIFAARCASCHAVNQVLTGPALAGVHERRSIDWLVAFIQSSQTLIKKGDKDAVALFEKFNKIPMPDHADLKPEQIKSIVEYVKIESAAAGADKAPFAKLTKLRPAYVPLSLANDYGFFISFLVIVGLLIGALLFAVQLKEYQRLHAGQ